MKAGLLRKLQAVLKKDPEILTDKKDLQAGVGFSEAYIKALGLSKHDLKQLEKEGVTMRGRLPTEKGHLRRWVFVGKLEDFI